MVRRRVVFASCAMALCCAEWFPPNSWIAIASVSGAHNWRTRPNFEELHALLENYVSTLQADDISSVD
jgi:hypothetical protein